ncbi:MAG: bile acid beta-glucosidase [Leptolyngbyaceae cyanobacterium RU_5_1]|nr:bile acid beta-glucosidase [Leptolyngbyaceae cyanobacterium RU_5_1]
MQHQQTVPHIPTCTWSRAIGLGWQTPYTVRYASNLDDGSWHGMPLGGFGAGCIGRSHRGDFNLWHIDGGEHVFKTIPACQFSVLEHVGDQTQAYALCTELPDDGTLSAWQWYPLCRDVTYNVPTGKYHALYPRSWFVYQNVFQADLTCEQFSPIWAHNYQETSYPVAVFQWTAHNPTAQPITLSIMLTWQNMVGWFTNALKSPQVRVRDDGSPVYEYQPRLGESVGNFNQLIEQGARVGIVMGSGRKADETDAVGVKPMREGEGQWAIALTSPDHAQVFYHTRWNPVGDGAELWQSFARDGSLPNVNDSTPAGEGEQVGAAIAVRFTLQPGETCQIPVVLSWDFPVTEFAAGVEYLRRYTDFFGRNGQNAWAIARTALKHYPTWQEKIQHWQQPILDRDDLPDWFKMALFNELYDLTDGGTLWSAASDRDPVGQFAVLECIDYRWYESLDVRLYGSFGLLMLFPELEKSVLRAFARAIPARDDRTRVIGYYYTIGAESPQAVRKVAGATPHDLGAPNEHVWEQTNYTSYQDCNLWKDLSCDFVLQVYRDFLLTGATDIEFLQDCWSAVVQTLNYLKSFDRDGDGIPENSGAPDQTFDDWKLQGVSAYCGGLWLAALEAAIATGRVLAEHTGDLQFLTSLSSEIATFQSWLEQARPIYQEKLWNGQHYRLDSNSGSDIVMADQLCGQFYARLLKLPDIVPEDCTRTALQTIYDSCFVRFNQYVDRQSSLTPHPCIGAANGVRPDGTPENPNSTHPLEVWIGINFGLAAFWVQMGMRSQAMQLTEAVVNQIYEHGLQFRTPEAITATGTFRASHYLRAMAIWAIYGIWAN